MSYTLTLDIPEKTMSYVRSKGPRFQAEMSALFVAIVSTKMQYETDMVSDPPKGDLSCLFGKAKLEGDPVDYQRKLRDEW